MNYQRRVVCAALRIKSGEFAGTLVLGPRHFDATMRAALAHWCLEPGAAHGAEQGFIDQHGVFMDRREAFDVAVAAGQLLHNPSSDATMLVSEDLY